MRDRGCRWVVGCFTPQASLSVPPGQTFTGIASMTLSHPQAYATTGFTLSSSFSVGLVLNLGACVNPVSVGRADSSWLRSVLLARVMMCREGWGCLYCGSQSRISGQALPQPLLPKRS